MIVLPSWFVASLLVLLLVLSGFLFGRAYESWVTENAS